MTSHTQPPATPAGITTYRVGLLRDVHQHHLLWSVRFAGRMARDRNWRAVRSWLNGWLAEPYEMPPGLTRCGSGWTERRALRDLDRRAAAVAGRGAASPSLADLTDLRGHLIDPPLMAPPNPVPPKRSDRKPVRGTVAGRGAADGGER